MCTYSPLSARVWCLLQKNHGRDLENFYETEPGMKYRRNRSHNIRALELYLIFKIKTALFYVATELFTKKWVWIHVSFSKNSYLSQSCWYCHHSRYLEDCDAGPEGGEMLILHTHALLLPSPCQPNTVVKPQIKVLTRILPPAQPINPRSCAKIHCRHRDGQWVILFKIWHCLGRDQQLPPPRGETSLLKSSSSFAKVSFG